MFVYRGEKLGEENYISEERKRQYEALEYITNYYGKKIAKAKLEVEEIIADKDGKMKNYLIFTKPVEELTEEEKQVIIDTYDSVNAAFNVSHPTKNPTNFELKAMREIVSIWMPNPLERKNSEIELYTNMIKEAKEQYNKSFMIALNREHITRENIDLILEKIKDSKEKGLECRVGVDGVMLNKKNDSEVDYVYSKEEMNMLLEVDNALKNSGYKGLVFCEMKEIKEKEDFDKAWTMEQVVEANRKIDSVAEHILKSNLSPFEAMIYIHKVASRFVYKSATGLEESRVLPSILNTTNIVCAGYASLVKAIVDRVNLPGLKCDLKGCAVGRKNDIGGHCHNVVTITDSKYDIDGVYIEDACWDSRLEGESTSRGIAHCLYPVGDIMNFNNGVRYYDKNDDTRIANLIIDPNDFRNAIVSASGNALQRALAKISSRLKRKSVPFILKEYGDNSPVIDIEKYREALRIVYRTKIDDEKVVEKRVEEDIQNSIARAVEVFNSNSANTFASQMDTKQREEITSKSNGPSA